MVWVKKSWLELNIETRKINKTQATLWFRTVDSNTEEEEGSDTTVSHGGGGGLGEEYSAKMLSIFQC